MLFVSLLFAALGATPDKPASTSASPPLTVIQHLGPTPLVLQGGIAALAFSSDGRHLLALSRYGRLIRWELQQQQIEWLGGNTLGGDQRNTLLPFPKGDRVLVVGDSQLPMSFDPPTEKATALGDNPDCRSPECPTNGLGARLGEGRVITTAPGALQVWSLERPDPIRRIPVGDADRELTALATQPSQGIAAVGGEDGKLELWDAESGEKRWEADAHDGAVASATFTPDGQHIVTVGVDGWARLWTTRTGSRRSEFRLAQSKGADNKITSIVSSDDGRYSLLSLSAVDGTLSLELWDLQQRKRRWQRANNAGFAAAFSPDGTRLALATLPPGLPWLDELDTVLLLDTSSGKPIAQAAAHAGPVTALVFLPDGAQALSAGADGVIAQWDLTSGKRLATWKGHRGGVSEVASVSAGALALSTGADGSTRLWRVKTGEQIGTWVPALVHGTGAATPAHRLKVSADGAYALVPAATGLSLFDIRASRPLQSLSCSDAASVPVVGFASHSLVGICPLGTAALSLLTWDLKAKQLSSIELQSTYEPQAISVSSSGVVLLAATVDTESRTEHSILKWDLATDDVRPVFTRHDRPVTALEQVTPSVAVSASWDGTVRVWSVDDSQELGSLELWRSTGDIPRSLAVSPDKKFVLIGTERGAVIRAELPALPAGE